MIHVGWRAATLQGPCKPASQYVMAHRLHLLWQLAGRWAGEVTGDSQLCLLRMVFLRSLESWLCTTYLSYHTFHNACIGLNCLHHLTDYTRYRKTNTPYTNKKECSSSTLNAVLQILYPVQYIQVARIYWTNQQHEPRRGWNSFNLELHYVLSFNWILSLDQY